MSSTLESIDHRFFDCEAEFADTKGLCERYGFAPENITNTIVVAGKAEPTVYAACVVLSTFKLDVNKTVRKLLGVKRATFATPDETELVTGQQVGGIGPFGLPPELPVYVDRLVMYRPEVLFGGGSLTRKVICAPSELRKLANVRVVHNLGIAR